MAQYKSIIIVIWYLFLSWASDLFMKSLYAAELTASYFCRQQKQARICTLYLPLLSVLLDHTPRFHGSKYDLSGPFVTQTSQTSSTMNVPNSEFGADSNRSSSYSAALKQSPSDSLTPQSAAPLREATQIALQVPLDEDETKELLLCALYIFKNLEQGKYSLYSRGGGGRGVLWLLFAGYVRLASQSPYPIIIYSVANYRSHLSHFLANM